MENTTKINPKNIALIIILVLIGIILYSYYNKTPTIKNTPKVVEQTKDTTIPITITEKKIEEENFTGTRPAIFGGGVVVTEANKYVEQTVVAFRKSANEEVPDIRKTFGKDHPMAQYTIDISANHIKGPNTESIVIEVYSYTGGANGNSIYKVFTSSFSTGKIISLKSIIKSDKQKDFLVLLKKKLIAWRPEGSNQSVVFESDVNKLTMNDISNWSLDDKNLIVYFDKYSVGPGALGPVPFPIPISIIKDFLVTFNVTPSDGITYTNATKDLITVELPYPNAVTGKKFSVIGKARGSWFFEASFPIELRDKNGKLLATGIAQADGDWMTSNFVSFKADLEAPESYIGPATLVLKKDNASGLPEHDASISFPITVEY